MQDGSAALAASTLSRPSGRGKAAKGASRLESNAFDIAFDFVSALDSGLAEEQGEAPIDTPGQSA
jgi:hypothetical protein